MTGHPCRSPSAAAAKLVRRRQARAACRRHQARCRRRQAHAVASWIMF
jgi:hypothetical protein